MNRPVGVGKALKQIPTIAAIFCCLAGMGLHAYIDDPPAGIVIVELLFSYFLASIIALWVVSDAKRDQLPLPYDFDSFVFFGWIIVAPLYLIKTRRWRALFPILWFIALYVAATLFSDSILLLRGVG